MSSGRFKAFKHGRVSLERTPTDGAIENVLAEIGVALIETDAQGNVVGLNPTAERITGWTTLEAHGEPLSQVFKTIDAPRPSQPGTPHTPDRTAVLARRDGTSVPVRHATTVAPVRAPLSVRKPGTLILFRDLSAEQFLSLQLAGTADCDALTGLFTRRSLEDRIARALVDSKSRGVRHGLCYFDLDRFRLVNLTCGHDAGDDLLQWVSTRIHEVLGPADSAARIGADLFALLLPERTEAEVEKTVREFQRRLAEFRFAWGQKSFAVSASVGVVFFGADEGHPSELLSAADAACRKAKSQGGGRLHRLARDDEEAQQTRRSMDWVAGLQNHLSEGKLKLYAQGVHPLGDKPHKGVHFEVLVRQVGDDGQLHSPVRIIHAAENIGLMGAIDRFVVRQTLQTLGALPKRAMKKIDACAINLSGVSLLSPDLLDFIAGELAKASVPPSKVCFEITETAALANLDEVLWLMQELKGMGCRFAIDDFGSGHASYAYVERLPVDHVKIDGAFVRDILDNAVHRAIVESINLIGRTLNIKTVAESVELPEVRDVLTAIGIDAAQGWLFDKPRPLSEVCASLG